MATRAEPRDLDYAFARQDERAMIGQIEPGEPQSMPWLEHKEPGVAS
jgi:hypothetical protein